MGLELQEKSRPIICFHRGYSSKAPENTLSAIKMAFDAGADMIEVDIRLTRDLEPVIIHDQFINRVSNGKGNISKYSLSEIKNMDFGSWFSETFINEQIPTLREVFDLCKNRITLDLEIKCPYFSKNRKILIQKVIGLIKEYGLEKSVLITSFNWGLIRNIKKSFPDPSFGLIFDHRISRPFALRYARKYDLKYLVSNYLSVDDRFIPRVHKAGRKIFVYTVDDLKTFRDLESIGIDGVITDGIEGM